MGDNDTGSVEWNHSSGAASPENSTKRHDLPPVTSVPESRTLRINTPHTTFFASHAKPQLSRHAAMSLLLKTSEGRERTLRFFQNILRFYIFVKLRRQASVQLRKTPLKTASLLLLVFILSTLRKIRNLSEILAPFTDGKYRHRLSNFAGSFELSDELGRLRSSSSSPTAAEGGVSATRWLWTEKHAWAAMPLTHTEVSEDSIQPPASDEASLQLRARLEGVETTLSLLDTIADGVALFARLGITITLPLKLLQRFKTSPASATRRPFLHKLFRRSETLADLFWLLSTLTSLGLAEWERREVWQFGKKVRRLMRDEEILINRMKRERESQESLSTETEEQEWAQQDEEHLRHIRSQRRTLRDLRGRLTWLWWERLRLIADGIFATYDVFEFSSGSEAVRAVAGMLSAGIGFSQVWSESLRLSKIHSH